MTRARTRQFVAVGRTGRPVSVIGPLELNLLTGTKCVNSGDTTPWTYACTS